MTNWNAGLVSCSWYSFRRMSCIQPCRPKSSELMYVEENGPLSVKIEFSSSSAVRCC